MSHIAAEQCAEFWDALGVSLERSELERIYGNFRFQSPSRCEV